MSESGIQAEIEAYRAEKRAEYRTLGFALERYAEAFDRGGTGGGTDPAHQFKIFHRIPIITAAEAVSANRASFPSLTRTATVPSIDGAAAR